MPISHFLRSDGAFGPDDLKAISEAFSKALTKLGLSAHSGPTAEHVARKIIHAALAGERDPVKLCDIAVEGGGNATAA
jgi:hypothetical protein